MKVAKLLSFTVANYRSFYTPQTFDFTDNDGLPRTLTVIYGPNSSGKSNSACALQDFRASIINSSNANWQPPYMPFLLREGARGKPTTFEAVFSYSERRFSYSFSYVADRVTEETLKAESPKTGRMNLIFHRGENGVDSKAASKNGFNKTLEDKTRPETLLITKAREDNNPFSAAVFNLIESTPIMLDQGANFTPQFIEILKRNEDLRVKILKLLRNCDFSIRDIAIGETKFSEEILNAFPIPMEVKQALAANGGTTFSTLHAVRDDELSIIGMGAMDFWTQESNGTRKFFEMAVPIVSALDNGHTLYLDEYGTYLHPNLAKALVSLFRSKENKTGARLILNTQGTPLMGDVAERDDIVFIEKDMAEESHVIPLKDRGARTTEPLESRYLRGLYGAVPRVRNR
ncbi:AAA family ATPase [Adlercreutzia sp. ZJ141]|uniref:AAA family ATPase n=1 Tax=Adlercreutzia sp. ZJ141 TaxID=2709406 RepID=UPI0013EB7CE0|nr:ATP-binding protein [Adlercreutzia sp. ZJ141]